MEKPALSLRARSGIDPRWSGRRRLPRAVRQDTGLSDSRRSGLARAASKTKSWFASAGRCTRSGATPSARRGGVSRRRLRGAHGRFRRRSSGRGRPSDRTDDRSLRGPLPPPLTQCKVVAPAQYRTRLHPLSVNSTTTERMHYVDHTVHAPAMTLEHLVDQYWFPALGLLISAEGQRLAPFVPRPLPGGVLVVDQGDRRAARCRTERASVGCISSGSRARHVSRRASPDRQVPTSPITATIMLDIVPLIDLGATNGRCRC